MFHDLKKESVLQLHHILFVNYAHSTHMLHLHKPIYIQNLSINNFSLQNGISKTMAPFQSIRPKYYIIIESIVVFFVIKDQIHIKNM